MSGVARRTPPAAVEPTHPGAGTAAIVVGLLLVFAAGVGISTQSFVNGRLADHLGSSIMAGGVNTCVSLFPVALLVGVSAPRRAGLVVLARPGRRPRWWQLACGLNGGFYTIVAAEAAPRVGIALLTVAAVTGSVAGGLALDRFGLSPAGRRPANLLRVVGAVLCVGAMAVGALGSSGSLRLGLLVLMVLAGALVSVQGAAMAHMARTSGDPLVGVFVNFTISTTVTVAIALALTGGHPPGSWSAPPLDWIGGLFGAAMAFTMARVVGRVGVLQVALAGIAGQAVGAMGLDLLAPVRGREVTALTVLGVLMAVAGASISNVTPARIRAALRATARP